MSSEITIAGAGLVGSLLAILLAKEGFQVKVFEKRPNPLIGETESGRSINLALSYRGLKALELAGVREPALKLTIPMEGRMLHEPDGELIFQPYGKAGQQIYSVSRSELTRLLIREAQEKCGVKFYFNSKIEDVNCYKKTVKVSSESDLTELTYNLLIGADGAFSPVRGALLKTDRFNYSQSYLEYGYKELHIHPDRDGKHQLFKNSLHIWPREKFMLIALPNLDGSFTVTLFLPFEGEQSFANLQHKDQILNFFKTQFPDACLLMPQLLSQFLKNPTSSLVTIKCFPWVYEDSLLLIGDAAHAIVPFYGQGMNAGFEDCRVLVEIIRSTGGRDWGSILKEFQMARKENTDAIAELALQNFVEMRDLVADEKFLLRKKIEARIHQKYPEYLPLYSMVTFSDYSYKEALEKGNRQEKIMEQLMSFENIEEIWETDDLWKIFDSVRLEWGL